MLNSGLALACFILVVLLTIVFLQLTSQSNPFLVIISVAILVNVGAGATGHLLIPTFRYWHYTPPFVLLVTITIFCMGAVFSSASLQMLQTIDQSGGRISVATLHEGVIKQNLHRRLQEHVAAGRLAQTGDAYVLTDKGQFLITWIGRLKSVFSIRQTGIY